MKERTGDEGGGSALGPNYLQSRTSPGSFLWCTKRTTMELFSTVVRGSADGELVYKPETQSC